MVNRRQTRAGEGRVGRGFVPAHAFDRVVGTAGRVGSRGPGRGTGQAGLVAEPLHGVLPGQRAAGVDEGLAPERRGPVAALIHERLVLPVRDLEPGDPEVVERRRDAEPFRQRAAADADHARRHRPHGVEAIPLPRWLAGHVERLVSGLGQAHPDLAAGQPHRKRRAAEHDPRREAVAVRSDRDLRAGGLGGDDLRERRGRATAAAAGDHAAPRRAPGGRGGRPRRCCRVRASSRAIGAATEWAQRTRAARACHRQAPSAAAAISSRALATTIGRRSRPASRRVSGVRRAAISASSAAHMSAVVAKRSAAAGSRQRWTNRATSGDA